MPDFTDLLRRNANYRNVWLGQVVSETGDYFNNVAVFSLALETTGSGLVVSMVMLARAIPAVIAGPFAGVLLDRFDRKRIMIASDLIRSIIALAFIVTIRYHETWLLYVLSALLMFASPFFSSGRASILPSITSKAELHTANSLTQTTQWATLTAGTMLGGLSAAHLGYHWAFIINALSFLFSAAAVSRLRAGAGGFRAPRTALTASNVVRPWNEYKEGLLYMRSVPLVTGIGLISAGWALGGGAAQVLFALFGEQVFRRGAAGIGTIWGFAGVGLLVGGAVGHLAGRKVGFEGYKRAVTVSYLVHGAAYVAFSKMEAYWAALLFILLSRVGMAVTTVLNNYQLLRSTPDEFRGRVFSTLESLRWSIMMISMALAGVASEYFGARAIGVVAGVLGSLTAVAWGLADWVGRLPQPPEAASSGEAPDMRGGTAA
jgi:MFS family permease